jgi:hypothetical protein
VVIGSGSTAAMRTRNGRPPCGRQYGSDKVAAAQDATIRQGRHELSAFDHPLGAGWRWPERQWKSKARKRAARRMNSKWKRPVAEDGPFAEPVSGSRGAVRSPRSSGSIAGPETVAGEGVLGEGVLGRALGEGVGGGLRLAPLLPPPLGLTPLSPARSWVPLVVPFMLVPLEATHGPGDGSGRRGWRGRRRWRWS